MSLAKLKDKLSHLKDQIDEAEEREQRAKEDVKEAEEKAERNQVEADGVRRRCQLLSQEYEKVMSRVEQMTAKLHHAGEKNKMEESARRELEDSELEGDEQTAELESDLKEAQRIVEETQHRLTEAERREIVLQKDYQIASMRCSVAEKKIEELESVLETTAEKAKDLERFEDESFEREQVDEEKITFLGAQVKEEQQRGDDAEAREKRSRRIIDGIEDEIRNWEEKKNEVQNEMKSITDIVDDI